MQEDRVSLGELLDEVDAKPGQELPGGAFDVTDAIENSDEINRQFKELISAPSMLGRGRNRGQGITKAIVPTSKRKAKNKAAKKARKRSRK